MSRRNQNLCAFQIRTIQRHRQLHIQRKWTKTEIGISHVKHLVSIASFQQVKVQHKNLPLNQRRKPYRPYLFLIPCHLIVTSPITVPQIIIFLADHPIPRHPAEQIHHYHEKNISYREPEVPGTGSGHRHLTLPTTITNT